MASLTGMQLLLQKRNKGFWRDFMTNCQIWVCILCCFCFVFIALFAASCFILRDLFGLLAPLAHIILGCLGCCMNHTFLLCLHC